MLAFDYRYLGENGGQPRQIAPLGKQRADLQSAIEFARTLPDVDRTKVAIWGFSSGGHVFAVAAGNPKLAAAIAHAPLADGPAAGPNAMRHQTLSAALRFTARGLLDLLGRRVGRQPLLVPLAGTPGTVTSLTTPDALVGARAPNPSNRYPDWQQQIAAGSALSTAFYRPGRHAPEIECPLLVLVYNEDGVALAEPAASTGRSAPRGEVVRLPGGHYAAFLEVHEHTVEVLVASCSATSSTTRRSRRTRSDGLASATTRWTNATFGRRAVQAQDAVRHRAQTTGRDRRATRIAHPVGPLVQLRQGSLNPVHASLERLANPDVGQTTHRLRCAIADSLAEAHRATTLGTLRQHFQTLAVTVPARLELSAYSVKVEITGGHHPYGSPSAAPDLPPAGRWPGFVSAVCGHSHPGRQDRATRSGITPCVTGRGAVSSADVRHRGDRRTVRRGRR